jgi:hypothetical protein
VQQTTKPGLTITTLEHLVRLTLPIPQPPSLRRIRVTSPAKATERVRPGSVGTARFFSR